MKHWLLLSLCLTSVAAPRVALGQSTIDKAQAEHLFRDGLDLFDAGKHAEACTRFEQSQRLDPKPSTLINLGLCHEKIGRTATAWQELVEAKALADKSGEAELATTAAREADRLVKLVPKVRVRRQSPEPKVLSITLDQAPFDAALLDTALPIDPGAHRIEISAEDYVTLAHTFSVPTEAGITDVVIPALQPQRKDSPDPPKEPPIQPTPPADDGGPRMTPLAAAGFIAGGASLLIATLTGSISLAMTSSLKDACDDDGVCGDAEAGDLSTANGLANASNVTFALAGVGAVIGVVGLFVGGDASEDPAASKAASAPGVTARPIVVGDAGLGLELRF